MLDELNNILDRINNWIIFTEARNSGLLAINIGLLSFIYSTTLDLKNLLAALCVISILILAYSFLGINPKDLMPMIKLKLRRKKTCNTEHKEKQYLINTESKNSYSRPDDEELKKYSHLNIYKYKDIWNLEEDIYLHLVYTRLLKKNENEDYPIKINKQYQFKLAHRDIAKKIRENSRVCLTKAQCFYLSICIFIITIMLLGIAIVI